MKNVILRKPSLTSTYAPLASTPTVGTFWFRCPSLASGIFLRSDDGVMDVPLERSQQFTLEGIDLSTIYAKGGAGDYLIILGVTR